jgi:hypothetical protein
VKKNITKFKQCGMEIPHSCYRLLFCLGRAQRVGGDRGRIKHLEACPAGPAVHLLSLVAGFPSNSPIQMAGSPSEPNLISEPLQPKHTHSMMTEGFFRLPLTPSGDKSS